MTVAAPDHLHVTVHRAVLAARDFEDNWGSPLETSLAAIALARHSSAYRADAERALARCLRWWRDERPRPISADVAALALTARAASDLQRANYALTLDAVTAVADLVARQNLQIPDLHIALSVWALDTLVPERDQEPWASIRTLSGGGRSGVNVPLNTFVKAFGGDSFDANRLVQDLLGEVSAAPGLSDACILIWLVTVAAEKLSQVLRSDDNALQLLVRRRAGLVDRVVGEVDERTFFAPDVADLSLESSSPPTVPNFLTSFEALLVDVALAVRDEAVPWLTYVEADALFGARADAARLVSEELERRSRRQAGWLLVPLAAALAAVTHLSITVATIPAKVANPASAATGAFVLVIAVVVGSEARASIWRDPLAVLFSVLTLTSTTVAINQSRSHPFISDIWGLVAGALIAAAASLLPPAIERLHARASRDRGGTS
ncbi:MAG TPA: hypothetical protein VG650_16645 [Mycobacteriales bacterium]|nr:hypothetical protein [Mycobacteriales bacterium]